MLVFPIFRLECAQRACDREQSPRRYKRGGTHECLASMGRRLLTACTLFLSFLAAGRAGSQPAAGKAENCVWGDALACEARCTKLESDACNILASMYAVGEIVPRDLLKAAELLYRACTLGSGQACNSLAVLFWKGEGVPVDQAKATGLARKACENGYHVACVNLGRWYYLGAGASEDKAAAAKLFAYACRQKIGEACHALAAMYLGGEGGLAKDAPRGAMLFKLGCGMNHLDSCESIKAIAAVCAQKSVPLRDRDVCELVRAGSVKSLSQECGAGKGQACRLLGHWFYFGIGVEEDKGRAVEYLESACRHNVGDACHVLGLMYLYGKGGVREDAARGVQWLKRGCKLHDEQSCQDLDAIADYCVRAETSSKDGAACREVGDSPQTNHPAHR
jgi:uncharacterized protein